MFSVIPARRQIICHIFAAFHSPRIRNGCRYTESHYSLVGMLGKEFGGGRVVVDTAGGVHAMVGVAVPASRTGSAHADDALHDCADSFFVDTVPGHRGMGRSGRLVVAVRRRRRRHRVDTCHAGSVLDEHATGTMAPPVAATVNVLATDVASSPFSNASDTLASLSGLSVLNINSFGVS